MKVTDEQIIKILHNAWIHAPGQYIADAYLTTYEMANILQISQSQAWRRLKTLLENSDKIKGVQHGNTWLWRYNEKME